MDSREDHQLATFSRQAAHYYPGRVNPIDAAFVHCTISPNRRGGAMGVANYFASPSSGGSTQWVGDDFDQVRCVADTDTCWGAYGHNSNGLHYELCGYADWDRAQWLEHQPTIMWAATQIAEDMKKYGIPYQYPAPIVNGRARNGIHTHYGLPGNDHTDPSPGPSGHGEFPMDVLLREVRRQLGLKHRVTVTPRRVAAEDRVRREHIGVLIRAKSGNEIRARGWEKCSHILAALTRIDHEIRPRTTVNILWQDHLWRSTDVGNDKIVKVARSIHTRFAD